MSWLNTRAGIALSSLIFTLLVVLLWHLAVQFRLVNPVFVASPLAAVQAIVYEATNGSLWAAVYDTTRRMFFGWVLASLSGIVLGAMIGSSRLAQDLLMPTLEVFRPLPASAAIPVAILIFGLNDTMSIAVIAFGSLWPVLLATIYGFRNVPHELKEVGGMLEMNPVRYFFNISLPSASIDIMPGLRIALAISLIRAVVTEMQASLSGVGQEIFLAQRIFRTADLYSGLIVIGLIGLTINQLLLAVERRLLRWIDN